MQCDYKPMMRRKRLDFICICECRFSHAEPPSAYRYRPEDFSFGYLNDFRPEDVCWQRFRAITGKREVIPT
jgi:hypothetical protein